MSALYIAFAAFAGLHAILVGKDHYYLALINASVSAYCVYRALS